MTLPHRIKENGHRLVSVFAYFSRAISLSILL